jgi:16S rRNA (cytosine967-C5)-methyltransferase
MKPAARIQAAIEVLDDIQIRHRAASLALSEWGKTHRFAGSGDRSAIGNLVFDALRRRRSIAWRFGADTPRALALGAASGALGLSVDAIIAGCDGSPHVPPPLDEAEQRALHDAPRIAPAGPIAADVPDWLWPSMEAVFGADAVSEGQALAIRAPVDLRVNTLKASREDVMAALAVHRPEPTGFAPHGVRIAAPEGARRQANVEAEAAHGRGWFEVQDEGSQVAALLTAVRPGERVLDLCAGAGGKSLAMAAAMRNEGSIVAYDDDKRRLRPIFERITRAGASIIEVLDGGDRPALARLGAFDAVLVDAPCSGTGTWRRRPDTKWRLKPASIDERCHQQREVLTTAARHVRRGGRLIYVTCSLLPQENTAQVTQFLSGPGGGFSLVPWREVWSAGVGTPVPTGSADGSDRTLLLSPSRHGTDGFFIACLKRAD